MVLGNEFALKNVNLVLNEKKILNNLSLEIPSKKITLIHGKSGSGKTSILNVLNFLYTPTSGEYCFLNEIVNYDDKMKINNCKSKIGYFHQELALIENITLKENIDIFSNIRNEEVDDEKVLNYLRLMDIEYLYDKNVSFFSGGERQRAAFLKLLIFNYDIILIDEPTNNLDEENIKFILNAILELKKEGKTIVIVSHARQLLDISDNILRMEDINEL